MNTSTKNTKQTVEQNQPRGGKAELILLSIDAHKNRYVVTRKVDGQSPQSPQRFSPERFLLWAKKQRARGERVVSCYEAGCFGCGLHRNATRLSRLSMRTMLARRRGSGLQKRIPLRSMHWTMSSQAPRYPKATDPVLRAQHTGRLVETEVVPRLGGDPSGVSDGTIGSDPEHPLGG